MNFVRFAILCLFATSLVCAKDPLRVLFETEKVKEEWNFVDYRFYLTNISDEAIWAPQITYYAAYDPNLTIMVDYVSSPYDIETEISREDNYTKITLKNKGNLFAASTQEVYFRIYKKNWTQLNTTFDWSYQKALNLREPNYFVSVYDFNENLLWGSNPIQFKAKDVFIWYENGSHIPILKWNGEDELLKKRFWLAKEYPLSLPEIEALAQLGAKRYGTTVLFGNIFYYFYSENQILKSQLNNAIYGFFNAFDAAEARGAQVELTAEDATKNELDLIVWCLPEIDMQTCKNVVQTCTRKNVFIDHQVVLATATKSQITCLETKKEFETIEVNRPGAPVNNNMRVAANVDILQNSEAWREALSFRDSNPSVDYNWLQNANYTGDGIVVGVYDTEIDTFHVDLRECKGNSDCRFRKSKAGTSFLFTNLNQDTPEHGTHVAGTIGGSGYSTNYVYRGVAPKVQYYSSGMQITNQIGNVANHSHTLNVGRYQKRSFDFDRNIFWDYKNGTQDSASDTLTKTIVFAAGNNGYMSPDSNAYGKERQYHSILANIKNPIIVGNMESLTKRRNMNSSMGPTWDGRIKPDVMAPGSTIRHFFDTQDPFVVYIDFIKFYHFNDSLPYYVLDFADTNLHIVDKYATEAEVVNDTSAIDGKALKIVQADKNAIETYVAWNAPFNKIQKNDSIEIRFKITNNIYPKILTGEFYVSDSSYHYTNGLYLNNENGYHTTSWKWKNALVNDLKTIRIDFNFDLGVISSVPCSDKEFKEYCYASLSGTSMAAPVVSGIAALLYQKYTKITKLLLSEKSLRNSTIKAILIHTAVDMVSGTEHLEKSDEITLTENNGLTYYIQYGKGPDFSTGWGYVNAKAALDKLDTNSVKEISVEQGVEKQWQMYVPRQKEHLRATLVWDDAAGELRNVFDSVTINKNSKLVNDLDMYLVSPSGKYHYPWRLKPLPTGRLDSNKYGEGLEKIKANEVLDAEQNCSFSTPLDSMCFDHLNNVEVVDIALAEPGIWKIVVKGRTVTGNDSTETKQIASLVADYPITETACNIQHPYLPMQQLECVYDFSESLKTYVTFSSKTALGTGDTISLYDDGLLIGTYTYRTLAGKTIPVNGRFEVILKSNNDSSTGWGYEIEKIRSVPYAVAPLLINQTKKGKIL